LVAGVAAAITTGGCVALPFATPPMTVHASPAVAFGRVIPESAAPEPADAYVLVTGRAAVEPLGVVEGLEDRALDVSAGYVVELLPQEQLLGYARHGAFLGLSAYPLRSLSDDDGWHARLAVTAMPELLVNGHDREVGGGMSFTVRAETFAYARGGIADASVDGALLGGALGEAGIGVEAGASVRGVGAERYWLLSLGVVFRLPAAGGVVAVPVWALADAFD
jgi:hypothetical protein